MKKKRTARLINHQTLPYSYMILPDYTYTQDQIQEELTKTKREREN